VPQQPRFFVGLGGRCGPHPEYLPISLRVLYLARVEGNDHVPDGHLGLQEQLTKVDTLLNDGKSDMQNVEGKVTTVADAVERLSERCSTLVEMKEAAETKVEKRELTLLRSTGISILHACNITCRNE
jgi:hypothetical protein